MCLFRKTSAEAETSVSGDDREAVTEPGALGPNKRLGGHRAIGRPWCPPQSQHPWAGRCSPRSCTGPASEPRV